MKSEINKVIKQIKDFATFSKSERNGVFILLSLIVLLILFNYLYPYFLTHEKYDYSAFDTEVKAFLKTQKEIAQKPDPDPAKRDFDIYDINRSFAEHKLNPFPFDPNTTTHEQWLTMGLTNKQAKTIEKYISKGGKYYRKEDFKRMHCITSEEYEILAPYIQITISKPVYPKTNYPKKDTLISKTEINSATIEDLKKIRGIGDYFATHIVEYRMKLGGYYSINQLLEIPKMDTARLHPLLPYLEINPNYVRKINVNKAGFDELKAHPYIGYNIALALINYRIKHGNYAQVIDIKKSLLINDSNYGKISKYICVD